MKCPKCGNEIKEDYLYCDVCGEEIRIVPDFDATIDDNIDISLTGVIDTAGVIEGISKVATKEIDREIDKEATKEIDVKKGPQITDTLDVLDINQLDDKGKTVESDNKSDTKKKPVSSTIIKALVLAGAICVVVATVGVQINKKVNEYYSVDYQYERAFEQFEDEKYDDSIKTLKRITSIAPDDERIKLLIADNYHMLSKFDEANAVLYDLLDKYPDDPNINDAIIKNYEANEDYQSINKFLLEVDDADLKDKYEQYIADDVLFSSEEGTYDEIINLELVSNAGSTIYYTIDGSEADTSSIKYSEPIVLDAGEHLINAIAVNDFGIKSNNIAKSYVVDFYKPDEPVLLTKAGTYNVPTLIDVKISDYDLCYYTIDGADPTEDDNLYQGPFAMYIGKHNYKFAVVSNKGLSSEVVSADISLDLITLVGMDAAKANLTNFLTASGKNMSDITVLCEQAYVYNNQTYYIINEYRNSEGGKIETGNHYAVDVLTGLTFRAILNKATGEYTLETLI